MKLFLDSSVLLAACGRATGASRFVVENAASQGWILQTCSWVFREVSLNLSNLPAEAAREWKRLQSRLSPVPMILSHPWPTVVVPAKDRPILFTAAAWSEVLLTLDRRDFGDLLGSSFYGLPILRPGLFLQRERGAGRLRP